MVDSEQTLNISFRSVSDDTVLYSEEVTVPAGESYTLEIPETYSLDDTEYVVLAGQGSVIEHNYYSPQRNYTVYYRDVNDLQNVDTVVTGRRLFITTILLQSRKLYMKISISMRLFLRKRMML